MQYTVTKKFSPVQIELTLETEDEVRSLWHRLNIADSSLSENYLKNYNGCKSIMIAKFSELWQELERICKEYGITI
jgi:hypothetical protein